MIDLNIPWPEQGDDILKEAAHDEHGAFLDALGVNWETYAYGYWHAADLLVKEAIRPAGLENFLVYPIIFLYRHYLELRLKVIIADGNKLSGSKEERPTHHRIDELWAQCRRILEKVWPEGPSQELDAVEHCIRQFASLDPLSVAFRYPADKDGKQTRHILTRIDLCNLREVMERLRSLLDGASYGISVYLDYMHDAQADEP